MDHVSSQQTISSLHSRLPKGELLVVDRARLLTQLLCSRRFQRRGPVWTLQLIEGGSTIVTLEGSVVTFTFSREAKRIAIGNQLIAATRSALAWPSLSKAA